MTVLFHVEAFTCAKDASRPATNEDQMVIVPGAVYAVSDGATDISGKLWDDGGGNPATGGRLASLAVARALLRLAAEGLDGLPDPAAIGQRASASLAEVYARLGLAEVTQRDAGARFRATLAAAFIAGDMVRLMRIGDSDIRLNGVPVFCDEFPAETVLITLRSEAWALLQARGVSADDRRREVRRLIVDGIDAADPVIFSGSEVDELRQRTVTHPRVRAVLTDADTANWILGQGIKGMRTDSRGMGVTAIDGVADPSTALRYRDVPLAAVETLEISSDGYPAMPQATSLLAWEAMLQEADSQDPDRIGRFASTKGRVGDAFHDDRTIIIVKATNGPLA